MKEISDRKKSEHDIYLCVGGKNPPVHDQLRVYFKDYRIQDIPDENHNFRDRKIVTGNKLLQDFVHEDDERVWKEFCT